MHVYCLTTEEGTLEWKSPKLYGLSLRDYFPVIVEGLVLVTTNPVKDFHTILDQNQRMFLSWAETGFAEQASARVRELPELRVNLGRINPRMARRTHSSTKHLHVYKLPRFVQLTPEVGRALGQWMESYEAGRLVCYRRKRPGWHMAFGDRLIGGENYTNPLHFSRALFAGASLIERVPPDSSMRWIDVPWCEGDFYFIEKCVYALWAGDGRPWTRLRVE